MSRIARRLLPALLLCQLFAAAAADGPPAVGAGPGSWHGRIGNLWLRLPGRETASSALQPPTLAHGRRLAQVRWSFSLPPAAPVQAWLCHPSRCLELKQPRGSSGVLAGLDAGQPLQLRFRLAPGAEPLQVRQIELIAEYR